MSPAALGGPGYALVERVRDGVLRHRMLEGAETVLVALSGGPDSTCLLDVLSRLGSVFDVEIVVAHVDHGLSEDSGDVAARVARWAAELGHDVHVMRIADLEGPNLQARARELRYGFLETLTSQPGAGRIATGHTLDDRVETTLARLVHGAGTEGLAGLVPVSGARIHPLLGLRRAETRAYCEERALDFVDDPANQDLRFERVAVRRLLVGAIEDHWGEGAVRALAVSAERLAEDATALGLLADRLYSGSATLEEGRVRIDRSSFAPLPRALRRRLLETAVGRVRDRSGGIEAALDGLERDAGPGARFAVAGRSEIELTADAVLVTGDGADRAPDQDEPAM